MITVQVRIVAWVQGDVVIGIGTQGVLSRVAGEVAFLDPVEYLPYNSLTLTFGLYGFLYVLFYNKTF